MFVTFISNALCPSHFENDKRDFVNYGNSASLRDLLNEPIDTTDCYGNHLFKVSNLILDFTINQSQSKNATASIRYFAAATYTAKDVIFQ